MLVVAEHARGTDTGRQRRANEDSLFVRSPLFVVADGMGGAQAGEIASSIAAGAFERGLPEIAGASMEERLAAVVRDANEQIHDLSVSDADRAGMGTTCTALYVGEEEVSIAHVGDSRLYRLRDAELTRLTKDHSLVEELVEEGRLTPEEADEHPQRSIITRALGPEHDVRVDSQTLPARDGDVYLVCSDGLTAMIHEAQIADILRETPDLRTAVRRLIEAANAAGGRDNITVILLRLSEVSVGGGEDSPTLVGAAVPQGLAGDGDTRAVRAAPSREGAVPQDAGESVARRVPRAPSAVGASDEEARRRRRRRLLGPVVLVLVLLAAIGSGGFIAGSTIYFVGADDDGYVTLYRGLPYELPFGAKLYTENYTSGATLASLPANVRSTVTDHKLRARRDGADLIGQIEQGKLAGQGGTQ